MGWTQPVCENKYRELFPGREPVRLNLPDNEEKDGCCFCETPTDIYIRIDPKTVPYPKEV